MTPNDTKPARAEASAVDPAAVAQRISTLLKSGLEQSPDVVGLGPNVVALITMFLDASAPMIAAAAERDDLAERLAAALQSSSSAEAELRAERDKFHSQLVLAQKDVKHWTEAYRQMFRRAASAEARKIVLEAENKQKDKALVHAAEALDHCAKGLRKMEGGGSSAAIVDSWATRARAALNHSKGEDARAARDGGK